MDSDPTSSIATDLVTQTPPTRPDLSSIRRVIAIVWTVVIMVLCWLPHTIVKEVEDESSFFKIPNLDKLIHISIFVLFSILWTRVWSSRRAYLWIMLGGIALGLITEIGQSVPIVNRDTNLGDMAADVVAVLVGLAVAPWVEPHFLALEARFFRGKRARAMPETQTTTATNTRH